MDKRILAILAVGLLALTLVPMDESDAEESITIRWTGSTLYHSTAVATDDLNVPENMRVYAVGEDGSMKDYISDPQKYTPSRGVSRIEYGNIYEFYHISSTNPLIPSAYSESVLAKYNYVIEVEERSMKNLVLDSVSDDIGRHSNGTNIVAVYETHTEETWCYTEQSIRLSHEDGLQYYTMGTQSLRSAIYYEATGFIETTTFEGSPYLYIVLYSAVTLLVGVTIFMCGRRPKL